MIATLCLWLIAGILYRVYQREVRKIGGLCSLPAPC
jgi:hypothetical protein